MYQRKELFCRMLCTGERKILFAFCYNTGLSFWNLVKILTNSYHFRVDPTAASGDKQETPLEIALGSPQHLELLHVLSKFMEMPDNVKHIQLAVLANSDVA